MKKNESITKIMSANVTTVQLGQPLSDIRKLMCDAHYHHIPIVDGKKLVGLVSFTDLMKINVLISGANKRTVDTILDQQFTIADIMTTQLTSIRQTETIRQAAELLSEGYFHSLPIVDNEENVVGIVTTTDLIHFLIDQY